LIFVINDGGICSLKMNLVLKAYKQTCAKDPFFVFKKVDTRYREQWFDNQVNLASSIHGNFIRIFLLMLKSPKDLHDGILSRIQTKKENIFQIEGFISGISEALNEYFDKPARTKNLLMFFDTFDRSNIFLIDEYVSINIINLKCLRKFGYVIYVSQDVAYNRFNFENNFVARVLMTKLETQAVSLSDLVIACSERDRIKYLEMGAKNVIYYPNIYPVTDFELDCKDPELSICIVLRERWGIRGAKSLRKILKALQFLDKQITVYMIGLKPDSVPDNIRLQNYEFIPSKSDYLRILSKSWVGINLGIHKAGSNERKYDYAMAGLVVFSDSLGVRGELLPFEYTFLDYQDFAAKLNQLLEFDKEKIFEMGLQNRKQALFIARKQYTNLVKLLKCKFNH
jgi:hypothetical protein